MDRRRRCCGCGFRRLVRSRPVEGVNMSYERGLFGSDGVHIYICIDIYTHINPPYQQAKRTEKKLKNSPKQVQNS